MRIKMFDERRNGKRLNQDERGKQARILEDRMDAMAYKVRMLVEDQQHQAV